MKKTLALLLAFVMVLSMLCACDTDKPVETKPQETQGNQSVETKPVETEPEEPVVLTCLITAFEGIDYDNNYMTTFLEEKFNVDLQFQVISTADDAATQLNLVLTSGEYPDLFLTGRYNTAQVLAGAEAGAFLPLNDYIVEGTEYYKMLEANPEYRVNATANDGNIYTFLYTDASVHTASEYKMWYLVEWMEKLGWETPPSTPEEFKQYLIDIRDEDVNGNGDPNDEIPLMGYYDGRKTDPICFLMNPFELYTDNFHYITDDGEIYFSAITDGWRKGLAYIADLYAEGLIAEETYIQDKATFKALLNKVGTEAVIGCYPNWFGENEIDKNVRAWTDIEALAPLKGDYQQSAWGQKIQLNCAISTQCEHPEKAFELLDWLQGPEGNMMQKYGWEDTTYEWIEAENYLGENRSVQTLWKSNELDINQYIWSVGRLPLQDSAESRYGVMKTTETGNTWRLVRAHEFYQDYYVPHNTPYTVWAEEDVMAEYSELSALINEYIKVSDTEFIMGIKDINDDAQWQAYLDQLDQMGLDRYIEVLEQYYGLK